MQLLSYSCVFMVYSCVFETRLKPPFFVVVTARVCSTFTLEPRGFGSITMSNAGLNNPLDLLLGGL